ncbi:transporter substrate-binding domain-containing protein [Pseudoduganella sp. OTU4001]|uniref:transporter substrate-binding domain-containing protein n=1 Tax=Pseudoduganella sp. OTU4001 TaxID=3043854 RepID=UPI00313E0F7C
MRSLFQLLLVWLVAAMPSLALGQQRIVLNEQEAAWLRAHPTVTIALDDTNPPMNFRTAEGDFRGLGIDYTDLVARIAGLKVRYVGAPWNETLRRAMAHEVDAVMGARFREERRVALEFTTPYMQIPIGMATRKAFKPVRTLADFAGSRVAIIKGTVRIPLLREKCPACQIVEVDSPLAGIKLVAEGGADAFFDDVPVVQNAIEIGLYSDFKVALYFYNQAGEVRYGVNNQMPELLSILNKAVGAISQQEHEAIRQRWLRLSDTAPVQRELALTEEEHAWLAAHPVIRVAASINRPPVELLRPDSPELQGISAEYLRRFEQMLNVRFDVALHESELDRLRAVAEGRADLVSAIAPRQTRAGLLFTRHYVSSPIVLFARLDSAYVRDPSGLAGRPVAVLKGSRVGEAFAQRWPEVRQVDVVSAADGLRYLREGKVDAYVGSLLTTGSSLAESGSTDIRVVGETGLNFDATFGVRGDWPQLVSILDKAMAAIPASERDAIKQKWVSVQYRTGNDYTAALKWLALALVLGALFIIQLQIMVKRRTRQLRQSEQRYRSLVEHAPEAIVVCDAASDTVLDLNSNAQRLFGRSQAELAGSDLKRLFAPTQPDAMPAVETYQAAKAAALQGGSQALERSVQRPDGSVVPCEVLLARLDADRAPQLRVSFFDITERKRSEAELFKYQTQLEELVSARTTQLEEALQRTESANQAKGVFLSNMSHEIRTPMNAILGYTQLMRRMPDVPAPLRKQIEVIDRSGEHLLGLINDVLEMSKIEAGRVLLQLQTLHLPGVVSDVEEMLRARAQEKGLRFEVAIGAGLDEPLLGDPTKLRQVLANTIGNAIKFTERGGVAVRAALRSTPGAQVAVRIDITDTGPGIAEQDRELVFAAFEQSAAGRRKGGTGLGMTISRQYARMMGGDLTIDTELGRGTTVHFDFILARAGEGGQPGVAPHAHLMGRVTGLAGSSMRPNILVVDDVASNRDVVRLMLEAVGLDAVREADSGLAAVELLRDWRPDLVLMDRRMPDMDGYQACAAIARALPGHPVKYVMVTASAFTDERQELAAQAIDGYLTKPLREQALYDEIQRVLPQVQYTYEEQAPEAEPADETQAAGAALPLKQELAVLPAALRQQLAELVVMCDARGFVALCEEAVRPLSPVLETRLVEMCEAYAFRQLHELLRDDAQKVE